MGTIFISYRREDSDATVGRIWDHLKARFGEEKVFRDKNSIPTGAKWPTALEEALAQCDVMLVIIGPNWLNSHDEARRRRLDLPGDYVRREVEAALDRNIPVIPVLVQGAQLPRVDYLPESIRGLLDIQAQQVRTDPDFLSDMCRLISVLPTSNTRHMMPGAIRAAADAQIDAPAATIPANLLSDEWDQIETPDEGDRGELLDEWDWDAWDFTADHYIRLGNASKRDSEYGKAAGYYGDAIQRGHVPATVWGNLGFCYNKLRRWQDALHAHDQALALNDDLAWVWSNRGDTLCSLGRYEEAVASYKHGLAISGTGKRWRDLSRVLRMLGCDEEAEAAERRAAD